MLDAYELSMIRTELGTMVGTTCRIDPISDTAGTQTRAEGSDVDCLVGQPGRGNATESLMYSGDEPGVTIWVPAETSVKAGDKIVDNRTERSYKVTSVASLHNNELLRALVCVEIRTPGANP